MIIFAYCLKLWKLCSWNNSIKEPKNQLLVCMWTVFYLGMKNSYENDCLLHTRCHENLKSQEFMSYFKNVLWQVSAKDWRSSWAYRDSISYSGPYTRPSPGHSEPTLCGSDPYVSTDGDEPGWQDTFADPLPARTATPGTISDRRKPWRC
jgi:hypothetical protein